MEGKKKSRPSPTPFHNTPPFAFHLATAPNWATSSSLSRSYTSSVGTAFSNSVAASWACSPTVPPVMMLKPDEKKVGGGGGGGAG